MHNNMEKISVCLQKGGDKSGGGRWRVGEGGEGLKGCLPGLDKEIACHSLRKGLMVHLAPTLLLPLSYKVYCTSAHIHGYGTVRVPTYFLRCAFPHTTHVVNLL